MHPHLPRLKPQSDVARRRRGLPSLSSLPNLPWTEMALLAAGLAVIVGLA
ncbi:MAG: hypothetical protein R3D84_13290 [Paracoccaceae bacterium]